MQMQDQSPRVVGLLIRRGIFRANLEIDVRFTSSGLFGVATGTYNMSLTTHVCLSPDVGGA